MKNPVAGADCLVYHVQNFRLPNQGDQTTDNCCLLGITVTANAARVICLTTIAEFIPWLYPPLDMLHSTWPAENPRSLQ